MSDFNPTAADFADYDQYLADMTSYEEVDMNAMADAMSDSIEEVDLQDEVAA